MPTKSPSLSRRRTKPNFKQRVQFLVTWLDENIILLASTFLLAFIPLYPKIPLFDILPGYIVRVRLEDAFIILAGLIWLVQLKRGKVTWKSPLFRLIGLYAAVGFVSVLSAVFIIHTVPLQLLHIGKSMLHLFRYLEYFFLFVMMYSAIKTPRQAWGALWMIIVTVLAVTFYGIGQRYWYWPVYSTMNREFSKGIRLYLTEHARVQSTFGGHYDLGAYLVIVLPILLAFAYRAPQKRVKWLLYLAHTAGLWLLIMSASRISFAAYGLAVLLVIALTAWAEPTWKDRFWAFVKRSLSFGLVSGYLFLTFGQDMSDRLLHVLDGYPRVAAVYHQVGRQKTHLIAQVQETLGIIISGPPKNSVAFDNSVLTPTDELPVREKPDDVYVDVPDLVRVATTSADGTRSVIIVEQERTWSANALRYGLSMAIRLDALWPNAIKGFLRNPLLGSGYATLNKESTTHFIEADSTDNNFLRVLGETGLLGFLTFFGIIFLVFQTTIRHIFDREPLKASMAVGLLAGSIGLLINALYIDVYAASKVAFTYWALVGLALAVFGLKQKKSKQSSKKSTILK